MWNSEIFEGEILNFHILHNHTETFLGRISTLKIYIFILLKHASGIKKLKGDCITAPMILTETDSQGVRHSSFIRFSP